MVLNCCNEVSIVSSYFYDLILLLPSEIWKPANYVSSSTITAGLVVVGYKFSMYY